jgi:hypothetical protein
MDSKAKEDLGKAKGILRAEIKHWNLNYNGPAEKLAANGLKESARNLSNNGEVLYPMPDGYRRSYRATGRSLAAVLWIIAASPAWSQPNHNQADVTEKHQSDAEGRYSRINPLLPPILLRPIQTQTYTLQPATNQEPQSHSDDGAVRWTDIAIVFLTFVLALCGVAGAGIAFYQWRALKEQVGKLGEAITAETDAGKARATENAAALAAAHNANEIAREGSTRELRPYIGISTQELDHRRNPMVAPITCKNFGKTPAYNVYIGCACGAVPGTDSDSSMMFAMANHRVSGLPRFLVSRAGVIQPGEKIEILLSVDQLPAEDIAGIMKEYGALMLYAEARYQNASGEWHLTRITQQIANGMAWQLGKFGFCKTGNDAD